MRCCSSIIVPSCSVFVFYCSSNVVIATLQSSPTLCTRYNGILFSLRPWAVLLVTLVAHHARLGYNHVTMIREECANSMAVAGRRRRQWQLAKSWVALSPPHAETATLVCFQMAVAQAVICGTPAEQKQLKRTATGEQEDGRRVKEQKYMETKSATRNFLLLFESVVGTPNHIANNN
jgi:hypothetical protein